MGSLQLWLTVGGVLSKHEQILGEKIQNFILKLLVTTDFQITSFVQAIACLAAVAVAKPEAEADPALLYGAYGYAGLGHVGYPYAGYGYGYAGYPFAAAGYASVSPSACPSIAGLAPAALPP